MNGAIGDTFKYVADFVFFGCVVVKLQVENNIIVRVQHEELREGLFMTREFFPGGSAACNCLSKKIFHFLHTSQPNGH